MNICTSKVHKKSNAGQNLDCDILNKREKSNTLNQKMEIQKVEKSLIFGAYNPIFIVTMIV